MISLIPQQGETKDELIARMAVLASQRNRAVVAVFGRTKITVEVSYGRITTLVPELVEWDIRDLDLTP